MLNNSVLITNHSGVKCNSCGDVIVSVHRHDFKYCRCEKVFVDGGRDYLRYGGDIENITVVAGDFIVKLPDAKVLSYILRIE